MVRTPVIASLVLGALVACPAAAQDKATLVLQPSSQWQLDMGEHRCRLARTFGTGASETLFYIEQFNPSAKFKWAIAGAPLDGLFKDELKVRDSAREVEVHFGPLIPSFKYQFRGGTLGKFGSAVLGSGPDEPASAEKNKSDDESIDVMEPRFLQSAQGKAIEWVALSANPIGTVRLALGNMEPAFMAMNFCMDDLVKSWGLDPDVQKNLRKPAAVANIESIARNIVREYPVKALRMNTSAEFNYRIIVDEKGRPESCVITNMSTAAGFDGNTRACEIFMQKARFEPAVGSDDKPVRSYVANQIRYVMPP